MTYQEIKDDAIAFHNKATRIENGEEITSSRLQKVLNEDEVNIVTDFLTNLSGDELNEEFMFIVDYINLEDSHISLTLFMRNYKDLIKKLLTAN
jgi:hypothetical protein